jgi:hypothetical protein
MFASTLLHRSSFLSRLQLPPSHPRYPSNALLHAICADASLYGVQGGTTGPNGISGFGAMHAGLCMAKALEDASMGKRLLETVQGMYLVRKVDQAITDGTILSIYCHVLVAARQCQMVRAMD